MRFSQESNSPRHLVRGYAAGELRIDDELLRTSVIVSASTLSAEPQLKSISDLTADYVARIRALDPELVLLGTGTKQIFPSAALSAEFLRASVGFEVMDTGAACRTFNVLVQEQRHVVAVLIL